MKKIIFLSKILGVMALALLVASPAKALIVNADIEKNAGISYKKLKLVGKIDSDDIKNGSIKERDIADEAVTREKIEYGAINTNRLADDAVTTEKIADGAISTSALDDNSVTSAKILDGAIVNADLADDAVTSAKILDGTIVVGDMADGAVTSAKILDGTIVGGDLAANIAITTTGTGTFNGNVVLGSDANDLVTVNGVLQGANALVFEGATADAFETTFAITDPTVDRTITFPNITGTVITTGDTNTVTDAMVSDTLTASNLVGSGSTSNAVDLATAEVNGVLPDANVANDLTISGGTINNSIIGGSTAAAGTFTSLTATGNTILGNAGTDTVTISGDTTTRGALTVKEDTDVFTTFSVDNNTGDTMIQGSLTTGDITAYGAGATQSLTVAPKGAAGLTLGGASMTALTVTTSGVGTSAVVLPAGSVDSTEILDGTVVGGDLASNIAVSTTGNIATTGTGTITSAGLLTANGGLTMDSGAFAVADTTGNVTGTGTMGTSSSRWSTIYADNVNFKDALTDTTSNSSISFGDNANATITLGDNSTNDSVSMVADTAITDGQWSISNVGAASFGSIATTSGSIETTGTVQMHIAETTASYIHMGGASNAATVEMYGNAIVRGALTSGDITAYGAGADADLTINAKGTGDITLGDANSDVTVANELTVTDGAIVTAGGLTVTAGGVTITAGGLDMTGDTITNVTGVGDANDNLAITSDDWGVSTAGVASGFTGVTSTGTVDFSGADMIVDSGTSTPASCTTGQIFVDTDGAAAGDATAYLWVCSSGDGSGGGADTWSPAATYDATP